MSTTHWTKKQEIPGRVIFMEGNGDLPKIQINTAWSTAEIYLHGAHITGFQLKNQPPLLFLSQVSRFEDSQAIRGGIPLIFPWFGPREGSAAHGLARTKAWELREIIQLPTGELTLRLELPDFPERSLFPPFTAEYLVTIGQTLSLELIFINTSSDQDFTFENCLHTYFQVGDIQCVSVSGLKGHTYLDKLENYTRKIEAAEHIKITGETDRIYLDAPGTVEIHDSKWQRRILVEKTGSLSTVLWNPWVARSAQIPDFGNQEFENMICVESGNLSDNRLTLPAGKKAILGLRLSSVPL